MNEWTHAWMQLEVTDPAKMEVIRRLRLLTKQILETDDKCVAVSEATAKKKALCKLLHQTLSRAGVDLSTTSSSSSTALLEGVAGRTGEGSGVGSGGGYSHDERVKKAGQLLKERQKRLDALELEVRTSNCQPSTNESSLNQSSISPIHRGRPFSDYAD